MGNTHFSGPVFSAGGFATGTDTVITPLTASTTIPSSTTTEDYNGRIIPLSAAAGLTITLPAATGTQATYRFLVTTTVTSNSNIIKVANATDFMVGSVSVSATTGVNYTTVGGAAASCTDTITMSGTTTGGVAGSIVELTDVATSVWLVNGRLLGSGTTATPLSAGV